MRRRILVLGPLLLLTGRAGVRAADPETKAAAAINAEIFGTTRAADVVGSGKGLSIGAARIAHDAGTGKEASDYKISSSVGNPGVPRIKNPTPANQRDPAQGTVEKARLEAALAALGALPAAGNDKDKQEAVLKEAARQVFALKPQANTPGAFLGLTKQDLTKPFQVGNFLKAQAGPLSNPAIAEAASGMAKQTLADVKFPGGGQNPVLTYKFEQTVSADINQKPGSPAPAASAFAINRDPIGVVWGETPEYTVTLRDTTTDPVNPLNLTLTAQATPGAASAALYSMDVSHFDFADPSKIPSDQEPLEGQATQLFSLTALLLNDGGTTSKLISLGLETGAGVTDSLGSYTPSDVLRDLNDHMKVTNGVLSLDTDLSFTVTLPEDPVSSVLFTRDYSAADASAAPEPSTIVSASIAALMGLGYAWRRRKAGVA